MVAVRTVLLVVATLAASIWIGSLVCLALVALVARRTLDGPSFVVLFREVGRLYRVVGTTCTGGVMWADYLVPTSTATACSGALCIFNYTAQSTSSLAKLGVDLPVNVKPAKTVELYELQDDLVLRNSTRS